MCLGPWGRWGSDAGGRVVPAADQLQELIKPMQAEWVEVRSVGGGVRGEECGGRSVGGGV